MSTFEEFLAKSDLEAWNGCLKTLDRQAAAVSARDAGSLLAANQALTVACYTQWLSGLSGNTSIQEGSRAAFERLAGALETCHRTLPSDETLYGIGIVAAWQGHRYVARQILESLKRVGQQNILLLLGRDNAENAACLRDYVFASQRAVFPPVVYIYCDNLLELGATDETMRVIEGGSLPERDPMTLDLLGKIHEQSGNWEGAAQAYARSTWPMHSYRAAICRCISRGVSTFAMNPEATNASVPGLAQYLSTIDGEISQREFVRIATFVNSCRWNQFDDWMIHYELAKFSFRLRRHGEAEKHFRAAFEQCPDNLRSAVGNLRFSNLSWMSSPSLYQDLDMMPEVLECGRTAIAHAPEAEPLARTATWIARQTRNQELVKRKGEPEDFLDAGDVEAQFGDRPAAIKLWRRGLKRSYHPRLIHRWLTIAGACRFGGTMMLLIRNVLDNSDQDFFVLWELGLELLEANAPSSVHFSARSQLDHAFKAVAQRLEEMSHDNFQNLIRAYELFTKAGRQDVAESLLSSASELAESPEEFLELAIARRKVSWFSSREGDQLGLTSLRKADAESRDRLERLQIARECCYYGDLARARAILAEERIWDRSQDLTPAEYALALSSSLCFAPDELRSVYEAAIKNLTNSRESGLIRYYPERFVDRLSNILRLDPKVLRRRFQQSAGGEEAREEVLNVERPEEPDGVPDPGEESPDSSLWRMWRARVTKAESLAEPAALAEPLDEICRALDEQDIDTLIALWEWAYERMSANLRRAAQVRLELEQDVTPISKSGTIHDDWRAQELTDDWRRYLRSTDGTARTKVLREIEAFNEREVELLQDWESRKEAQQRPLLAKALAFGRMGQSVVRALRGRNHDVWPVFWEMERTMIADLESIMADLDEQLAELSARVGREPNRRAESQAQ